MKFNMGPVDEDSKAWNPRHKYRFNTETTLCIDGLMRPKRVKRGKRIRPRE